MNPARNDLLDVEADATDLAPERDGVAFHRETLTGTVERVTFRNPKTGFCVLRVRLQSQNHLATIVGHTPVAVVGEGVEARGGWVNDPLHGYQFRADWIGLRPPATADGLERYLSAGMIPGIGPVTAQRLVDAFGAEVFEVIEHAPRRLCRVPGIGRVKAERIAAAWADRQAVCEVIAFLHPYDIGVSRAVRVFQAYGRDAIRTVAENPYRLVRELGIGFPFADAIAAQHGFAPDAPERLQAALLHLLAEASRRGHCALPVDELLALAASRFSVARNRLEAALAAEGDIVVDELDGRPAAFLTRLHEAERTIAERLRQLAEGTPPWSVDAAADALQRVEREAVVPLGEAQRKALRLALRSKVTVITGGPGVGKTMLVGALVAAACDLGARPLLCASTARAARRLAETASLEAKTIHRMLGIDPLGGTRRIAEPLDAGLVVVDEMSMVDVPLMAMLLEALPPDAALVLVGDGDQLPSIGPGNLFADAIGSGVVPVARLTDVFRQNAQSAIVANAHRINQGQLPEAAPMGDGLTDFYFVRASGTADTVRKIVRIAQERIPYRFGLDAVKDVQVLCPMNRGGLGARSLNIELQRALNPPAGRLIQRFGWTFGIGDKVMQIANDYDRDVFNGELGVVTQIDEPRERVVVSYDNREVVYEAGDLDQIALAYATTIHKAQGSEYPAVVMPLTMQHRPMLHRSLIYTGVTRARRLVVLVGETEALQIAVETVQDRRRWSKLKEWFVAESPHRNDRSVSEAATGWRSPMQRQPIPR